MNALAAGLTLLAAAPLASLSAQYSTEWLIGWSDASPNWIHHGDVDGDGDQDLVMSVRNDFTDYEVWWMENLDGLATLMQPRLVADGLNSAHGVDTADLDGDGDRDLLVAKGELAWFPNLDGTGGFGSKQVITTAAPSLASLVAAADVDGDGDLDVFTSTGLGDVWWHESLGGGAFSSEQVIHDGSGVTLAGLELADVDGDGDGDVVIPRGSTVEPAWFENLDGMGSFSGAHAVGIGTGWYVLDVADLDGDGDVDVAGGTPTQGLSWTKNDGSGGFSAPLAVSTLKPFAVLAADRDADGDVDLYAGASSGGPQFFDNLGGGSFASAGGISTFADVDEMRAPDLNGDGYPDLLTRSSNSSVYGFQVHLGDASAPSGFDPALTLLADIGSPGELIAADLDGDGDSDVATTYSNGPGVAWVENVDGIGGFAPLRIVTTQGWSSLGDSKVSGAEGRDLDGDGDVDLVWSVYESGFFSSSGLIRWSRNDGLGGFGPPLSVHASASPTSDVAVADLDGDGDPDAAGVSTVSGQVFWHANTDGLGTFGVQSTVATMAGGGQGPEAVEPADLDGDGDLDLLIGGFYETTWFRNDGAGAFSVGAQLFAATPSVHVQSVASSDLDADGDLDVVSLTWNKELAVNSNLGAGAFGPAAVQTVDVGASCDVVLEDLDGDGVADALLSGYSTPTHRCVHWLLNDGAGNLGAEVNVVIQPGAVARAVPIDLDLDGKLDVVWSDRTSGVVAWSRNDLCPALQPALETVRLGVPPNPAAFQPGASSGPVVGATWDPVISHSSFFVSAVLDFVAIGVAPANVPTGLGTLLVDVGQVYAVASSPAAGVPFAIPVPASCGLVGTPLFAQGASTNGVFVLLTNGLDLVLGSY
jgi:hypothetical protein